MTPIGEFLTLSIKGELSRSDAQRLIALHERLGADACIRAAKLNQVAALVARQLLDLQGDALSPDWAELVTSNRQRLRALQQALLAVTAQLDADGIAWALIENGGVLYGSDMPLEAFCAGDFDLIIDRDRWDDAQTIFHAAGYRADDRRHRPTNRVEFVREGPDGAQWWLNAGHLTFDRMWVPLPARDLGQRWLTRRVPSRRHPHIWVLRPEDALALVAMHTSLHSFVRPPGLRLHVDVDRLSRDNPIDWDIVLREIHDMGVSTRAFVSLSMARGLLDSPIPDAVLAALSPSLARWRAIQALLRHNSVVADGHPKLPRLQTILLDALIEDRPLPVWLRSILLPPRHWLCEHITEIDTEQTSTAQLHLHRFSQLARRWRPA